MLRYFLRFKTTLRIVALASVCFELEFEKVGPSVKFGLFEDTSGRNVNYNVAVSSAMLQLMCYLISNGSIPMILIM
jgi:hypothetical protein